MSITKNAQNAIEDNVVFIRANNAYHIPLEWPIVNGVKTVSTCDYTNQGKKINVQMQRDLKFDERCEVKLNLSDPEDRIFYELVRDWYDESDDPRIAECGIQIDESDNTEPAPFPRYDSMNIKSILTIVKSMLDDIGDSPNERVELLESIARYELQRKFPSDHEKAGQKNVRQGVLKGLDRLGREKGVEDGGAEVEE